jgi:hypothetical protein
MVPDGSRQGIPMSEIAPGRVAANGTSGPPAAPQRDEPERTSDSADTETVLVTDSDLAHARQDPAFRHQLVAHSLELLLHELNTLRGSANDATSARQIREGVDLAVRLASLLQRIDPGMTRATRAGG